MKKSLVGAKTLFYVQTRLCRGGKFTIILPCGLARDTGQGIGSDATLSLLLQLMTCSQQ